MANNTTIVRPEVKKEEIWVVYKGMRMTREEYLDYKAGE